MINSFLGQKIRQTQIYNDNGDLIPVTEISVEPSIVVQVKTAKTDGYDALQLGFDFCQSKNMTQPEAGHFKKTGQGNMKPLFLREVRLNSETKGSEFNYKIGDKITINENLKTGDTVKITGISKGKGFQGGVKRHGFAGGPRTHGQSDRERAPGAIGSTTTPGRVYKGKRMAGRMGGDRVTISGLKIIKIDLEKNRLYVKGLVPGRVKNYVIIQK